MSKKMCVLPAVCILLMLEAASVAGQMPKIDAEQRHLLLAASATATMEKELDYAASLGFRVMMGASRGNSEMILLLQRDMSTAEKPQYRLLAATDTATFQKEITEAAGQGFHAIARTFIAKPHVMSAPEIVVVMERSAGSAKSYEYQLLATTLTSTLEKEWTIASTRGYAAIGMLSRTEVMLLMEREAK
jgi:hypothetical protein